MKIKVTQLDGPTRSTVAFALDMYARHVSDTYPSQTEKYRNMAHAVRHGELLLCEYQYNGKEE